MEHLAFASHIVVQLIPAIAGKIELLRLAAVPERLRLRRRKMGRGRAAFGGIALQHFAGLLIQLAARGKAPRRARSNRAAWSGPRLYFSLDPSRSRVLSPAAPESPVQRRK